MEDEEEGVLKDSLDGRLTWVDKKGNYHRLNGPAIVYPEVNEVKRGISLHANGKEEWYWHGFHHRLNGPAVIYRDGDVSWYILGKLHRDDGPAIDWPTEGRFIWYKHGKIHRDDGPAIECPSKGNEDLYWYKDDKPYKPSAHEIMIWKMKKKES